MAFDWKNYLTLAKSLKKIALKQKGIEEACYRAAASRAYYSIYHIALDFAEKNLNYVKLTGREAGQNHSVLKWYYKKNKDYDYKKVGIILSRMHQYRKDCDYEDTVKNPKSLMENSILNAEEVLKIIKLKKIISLI